MAAAHHQRPARRRRPGRYCSVKRPTGPGPVHDHRVAHGHPPPPDSLQRDPGRVEHGAVGERQRVRQRVKGLDRGDHVLGVGAVSGEPVVAVPRTRGRRSSRRWCSGRRDRCRTDRTPCAPRPPPGCRARVRPTNRGEAAASGPSTTTSPAHSWPMIGRVRRRPGAREDTLDDLGVGAADGACAHPAEDFVADWAAARATVRTSKAPGPVRTNACIVAGMSVPAMGHPP